MSLTAKELVLATVLTRRITAALVHLTGALEVFSREFEGDAKWFEIERTAAGAGWLVAFRAKPTQGTEDFLAAIEALSLHEDGVELTAGQERAMNVFRRAIEVHGGVSV